MNVEDVSKWAHKEQSLHNLTADCKEMKVKTQRTR